MSASTRARRFQSTLPARGATLFVPTLHPARPISIHAPRTGSDHSVAPCSSMSRHFNPRSPHGERQFPLPLERARETHFNPRSPHGERRNNACAVLLYKYFNPRSPHGERPDRRFAFFDAAIQISIHAPRTGSDAACGGVDIGLREISIHAPRTGSDDRLQNCYPPFGDFNPRSPHGERQGYAFKSSDGAYFNPRSPHGERRPPAKSRRPRVPFQSTLPARGATDQEQPSGGNSDISIHAPRTGSDALETENRWIFRISIHAPRTGSDTAGNVPAGAGQIFQSTLPARGATVTVKVSGWELPDFNPRSPHGERRRCRRCCAKRWRFQSTLPARGATVPSLISPP